MLPWFIFGPSKFGALWNKNVLPKHDGNKVTHLSVLSKHNNRPLVSNESPLLMQCLRLDFSNLKQTKRLYTKLQFWDLNKNLICTDQPLKNWEHLDGFWVLFIWCYNFEALNVLLLVQHLWWTSPPRKGVVILTSCWRPID